ncbi:MAG: SulP family inorganic anion transporter, partial [Candidatus Gastranaerophilaceae bacterium]
AAQGIGNIFCGLTASLGGSAATMRTVAALNTGSTTRLTTIINPLILVVLLVYCSEFVTQIPLAVLAGILIKIGADIVDIKLIKVIKYAPKDDLYVLFLVFFLTVFYNLIFAVGAGITLAALLYTKRVADNTKLVHKKVYDIDIMKMERILERDYKHKIRVVHIEGQFFFGSATQLISHFDDILGTEYLIINYDADELLDISAVFALEDIIIRLKSQHIIPILVSNTQVINQLKSLGVIEQIGDKYVFGSETEAIQFAKAKLNITNK